MAILCISCLGLGLPPRREVLFKLNGAKLSEPEAHRSGGEVPRGGMQIIIAGR